MGNSRSIRNLITMATKYDSAQGFNLPSIDYTMTKPMDLMGSIDRGLEFGQKLKDIPNRNQRRDIQTQQQTAIQDGGMEFMGAKVGPDGSVAGDYKDSRMAELERALGGHKVQTEEARRANIFNQMGNRDASTSSQINRHGVLNSQGQERNNLASEKFRWGQKHTRLAPGEYPYFDALPSHGVGAQPGAGVLPPMDGDGSVSYQVDHTYTNQRGEQPYADREGQTTTFVQEQHPTQAAQVPSTRDDLPTQQGEVRRVTLDDGRVVEMRKN